MPNDKVKGFPDSSVDKESTSNAGDPGSMPGLGRSLGEGIGYPRQYSGLEKSMDCIAYGVTKSQTWLSDFHYIIGWRSPCSPRDSQESSPTPQIKSVNSSALSLLHSPTLTSIPGSVEERRKGHCSPGCCSAC